MFLYINFCAEKHPCCPYWLSDKSSPAGDNGTLPLKCYHSPVSLDAALEAEDAHHDGVQGHQGDIFEDLYMSPG